MEIWQNKEPKIPPLIFQNNVINDGNFDKKSNDSFFYTDRLQKRKKQDLEKLTKTSTKICFEPFLSNRS